MNETNIGSIQITQEKLIVVEGKDDRQFFQSLLDYMQNSNIQIISFNGKDKYPSKLKALALNSNFISLVKKLAIVLDADNDASAAFQSICSSLTHAGLPIPPAVLQYSVGNPQTIAIVIPPSSNTGKLESLCLSSVSQDPATSCVDSYINCLSLLPKFGMPHDIIKAKAHAFLSSRPEPDKKLGEAALAGYFPFSSAVFDQLRTTLSLF